MAVWQWGSVGSEVQCIIYTSRVAVRFGSRNGQCRDSAEIV